MNILFVCTGNTCRSPMAEGYVNFKYPYVSAKSCGIFADGSAVSENSKNVMAEIEIDISTHVSAPLTQELVNWADEIICMSHSHKQTLESFGVSNVTVLGDGITDPFGQSLDTYRICRDEIIKQIDLVLSPFSVVEIEHCHLKDISKLEEICFSTPWSQNALTEAFMAGTKFFVAQKDNKVLGYVGISAIIDEGYVTNIAVFPEYRNMGVATAMLRHLFDFAKKQNLAFISLEVRESNFTAISLYEKLGFKTEGKRKNFYTAPTEDALIMTKRFD